VTAGGFPLGGSVDDEGLIEQLAGGGGGAGSTVAGGETGEPDGPLKPCTVYVPAAVAASCGTVVDTCAPPGSVHR
jgi:hypothetical protein